MDVVDVLLGITRENQDGFQVDEGTPVAKVLKDIICQGLEDHQGLGEAKDHDNIFEIPEGCVEGGLQLIPLLNPDQTVGVTQVQLDEDGHTPKV